MEWYWIAAIVGAAVLVAAVVIVAVYRLKRKKRPAKKGAVEISPDEIDESRLCVIDDVGVAERVKALAPELVRTEIAAGLAASAASKAAYKFVLPASAKLASGTAGSFSGLGASMAAGSAGALVSGSVTAIMSAAAMVVGQYYMTQVTAQLKRLAESISYLGDVQDAEFKSRVFALHLQVSRAATFHAETIASPRLRDGELKKLDGLEHECIGLLGQASLMIDGIAARGDLDYRNYISSTAAAQKWLVGQRALFETLCAIADLKFTLHLGELSREQCDALIPVYMSQIEESHRRLADWHARSAERLGVKLGEGKRKRKGWDRAVHWLPGLFKKDMKYRNIPEETVELIESQCAEEPVRREQGGDLFGEDVEIIVRGGKMYYLPKEEN